MEGISAVGKRGERILQTENLLLEGFTKCSSNRYKANSNPSNILHQSEMAEEETSTLLGSRGGCINLGTAENRLVFDLLKDRMKEYNVQWEDYMFTYGNHGGILELRKAVAGFLTDRAKSPSPIDPEQIIIMNGGGICMEALTFAICDPGDAVMVATPYYGGIHNDIVLRPEATVVQVHFYSKLEPGQKEPFQVTMSKFESVYQEQTEKGVKIKAVLFMNPNNPLGDVCTKQEVLDVLHFCHRHSLHLIMNEVYMNTIFKEGVQHYSVLGLKPEEIPDPERVHFVWAGSKDMSMSGMRFGVIHTTNSKVIACIRAFAYFHLIPAYIQKVMARLLSDKDWLNNVYFPTNNKRLRESHKVTIETLEEVGIPYLNRPSCLFIYADFRKFMPSVTKANEMALFYRFIEDGAYIAPSQAFFADEQGWFRIIFSRPVEEVKLAMGRIAKTCQELLKENKECSVASESDTRNEAGAGAATQEISLEGLLSQLKSEISNSDWLAKNTADQWKAENPELFKEYMENKN